MIDEADHNKSVSIDADNQRVLGEEEVIEHTEELTFVAEEADRIQNGTYVGKVERRPMKQLQSPHVFWERFLSLGSLKVLLVENEDSTRHLVSAILHNCGYEVLHAENGVQAWTILEELTSQINIVLTEVTMPCLSGIQLLSRIMSHKTCKSIPVIMMSSNDSMNIVFKCLSKGAVDYLVKPLRKNELKNLWLHVWRRFHSPSDSGSVCGVQTEKATKSRSHEDLGNETGDKSEGYSGSIELDRDGSDNGSGTQSSWTKRAAEYDSPQQMSHQDQPAYQIGSTFAQFINPPEMQGGSWVPLPAADESVGQDNTLAATAVTQVSDVKLAKTPYLPCGEPNRKLETHSVVIYSNKPFGKNCTNEDAWKEIKHRRNKKEKLHHDSEKVLPIEFTTKSAAPQIISETNDLPIGHSNVSSMNNTMIIDGLYMPSVELTLRAPQDFKDSIESSHDGSIFQHSDFSAFLRYNSVSTANQRRTRNVRSSPGENSSDATKTKSAQNHQSESNNTQTNQGLYGSSSNENTCSTANIAPKVPANFNEKGNSEFMSIQPSSAPQPMQNSHLSCPQPIRFNDNAFVAAEKSFYQQTGIHQETNKLCNHHFHSRYPYIYCMPQMEQLANHENTSLQCGFSDIPGGSQIEGNAGDYTLDKSVSGSNHRSNRQTGYSIGVNPNGGNMETENVIGERSGANGGNGEGVGQNHFSNRETALNRFRQKKKGRCFEKKIRYQNRKKLAEQRPRIRGQFVRKGGETSKENDPQS